MSSFELDLKISEFLPDFDQMRADDEKRIRANEAFLAANPGVFVGVSLQDWLQEAKEAGIPYVPARQALEVDRAQFLHFNAKEPESQALWAQMCNLRSEVPAGHMVRWDPCAGLGVKVAMQEGELDSESVIEESFDMHPESDPRAYDIMYQYPTSQVPILSRPWVKAQMMDGYPVEFRVFIENSEVIGIANYYIQRDLLETDEVQGYVQKCRQYTEALIASMTARNARPWMPNYENAGFSIENGQIHGSVDYLVREDGEVLFLEAGPPFGAGAHPCAFENRKKIEGVALAALPDVRERSRPRQR